MQKKKWKKPELIVLVKGKPEEVVLAECYTNVISKAGDGPSAGDYRCQPFTGTCNACVTLAVT